MTARIRMCEWGPVSSYARTAGTSHNYPGKAELCGHLLLEGHGSLRHQGPGPLTHPGRWAKLEGSAALLRDAHTAQSGAPPGEQDTTVRHSHLREAPTLSLGADTLQLAVSLWWPSVGQVLLAGRMRAKVGKGEGGLSEPHSSLFQNWLFMLWSLPTPPPTQPGLYSSELYLSVPPSQTSDQMEMMFVFFYSSAHIQSSVLYRALALECTISFLQQSCDCRWPPTGSLD